MSAKRTLDFSPVMQPILSHAYVEAGEWEKTCQKIFNHLSKYVSLKDNEDPYLSLNSLQFLSWIRDKRVYKAEELNEFLIEAECFIGLTPTILYNINRGIDTNWKLLYQINSFLKKNWEQFFPFERDEISNQIAISNDFKCREFLSYRHVFSERLNRISSKIEALHIKIKRVATGSTFNLIALHESTGLFKFIGRPNTLTASKSLTTYLRNEFR